MFIHSFAASQQTLCHFVQQNCFWTLFFKDFRYEISRPSNFYLGLPLLQFFPFCVAILTSFGLRKQCRHELVLAARLAAKAHSQTSIQPYSGLCLLLTFDTYAYNTEYCQQGFKKTLERWLQDLNTPSSGENIHQPGLQNNNETAA